MFKPPADRPPPDFRDDEEKADVSRILAVLPADHPARKAHERGVDTIRISQLVADQPELAEALGEAFLAGRDRVLRRSGHFAPG